MSHGSDAMKAFEARLSHLRQRMEAGLCERASVLRAAAQQLDNGHEEARREIKTQSHKLRGIAGTYGHTHLTDMAAELEQRASLSPPAVVSELARELAAEAERVGQSAARASREESAAPEPEAQLDPSSIPSPPEAPQPHANASATAEGAQPAGETKGHARAGLRVLAMDDDTMTLKLLRLTLEGVGGFDATILESATLALTELRQREFDVVISDAMMPDMNGLEFCRVARQLSPRMASLPIIILSAATAHELGWHRSLDSNTVWLRKPFRPGELVQKIIEIVEEMHPKNTD